jgi:hypothetical protein
MQKIWQRKIITLLMTIRKEKLYSTSAAFPPCLVRVSSSLPVNRTHARTEHGLEGALRLYTAARDVGRQCDHRAGILNDLEMLSR